MRVYTLVSVMWPSKFNPTSPVEAFKVQADVTTLFTLLSETFASTLPPNQVNVLDMFELSTGLLPYFFVLQSLMMEGELPWVDIMGLFIGYAWEVRVFVGLFVCLWIGLMGVANAKKLFSGIQSAAIVKQVNIREWFTPLIAVPIIYNGRCCLHVVLPPPQDSFHKRPHQGPQAPGEPLPE